MAYTLLAEDVALRAGVTVDRVRQLARTGRVGKKISVIWMFCEKDVQEVIARKGKVGRPPIEVGSTSLGKTKKG